MRRVGAQRHEYMRSTKRAPHTSTSSAAISYRVAVLLLQLSPSPSLVTTPIPHSTMGDDAAEETAAAAQNDGTEDMEVVSLAATPRNPGGAGSPSVFAMASNFVYEARLAPPRPSGRPRGSARHPSTARPQGTSARQSQRRCVRRREHCPTRDCRGATPTRALDAGEDRRPVVEKVGATLVSARHVRSLGRKKRACWPAGKSRRMNKEY